MLKFANVASVGDVIRAYDFKPMAGRNDCFVEGKIVSKGKNSKAMFDCYEILVSKDVFDGKIMKGVRNSRLAKTVFVPFEVSFMEYDARIINLSK